MTTLGGLNASTSFIAKANPLNGTPAKKKTELHHALCNMLSSILMPLTDGGPGSWPPTGVDQALTLWYDAVLRIRSQLAQWMEKHSKHVIVSHTTDSVDITEFKILDQTCSLNSSGVS